MELAMKLVNKIMKLILWIKKLCRNPLQMSQIHFKMRWRLRLRPDPAWGAHNIIIKMTLSHGTCCETS